MNYMAQLTLISGTLQSHRMTLQSQRTTLLGGKRNVVYVRNDDTNRPLGLI